MTPSRSRLPDNIRRHWWAPVAILVFGGLALWAGLSLSNQGSPTRIVPPRSPEPGNCAPPPCAAPSGFEVQVSNLQTRNGLLTMQVTFHNATRSRSTEATSSRHTSPADFFLIVKDGPRLKPVVNDECPNWPELNIPRGASAGPEPLCFQAPSPGAQLALGWSPDLGIFFDEVDIPLR